MNVCLVSQEYPPETAYGGIGTQTWIKSQMLTRLGHTVHVVSCSAGTARETRSEFIDGVYVHRLSPPGHEFQVNTPAAYAIGYTWKVMGYMRELMRTHTFDLVNVPEYGAEGFAFQLDRSPWNWVPVITQLHGPLAMFAERVGWPEVGSEFHRIVSFMEGESIRLADGLMASSANIADFTASYYKVARDRIRVVHCGIDCNLFTPGDGTEPNGRPRKVLFAGNLVGSKGVFTVFDAVMRLRPKYPDIRLRLLGKDTDGVFSHCQRVARQHGADGIVESLGFKQERAELPDVFRDADVFAAPSRHETGVANVYVEAMACGCPVVASTSGGAAEAVIDGQCGILVPPADVEATAAAIDTLLADRDLRLRMGRAARRRAEEYFAVDKYIARVLSAYEDTIEQSKQKLAELQGTR
jgi:glycosyltransferase involved in cell wall biosynthesis